MSDSIPTTQQILGAWESNNSSSRAWDQLIVGQRGAKNSVDPTRPYAFFNEPEFSSNRVVEEVSTLFLVNQECPFRCLMCDLWKNTLDSKIAVGKIPDQIRFALRQLAPAPHVKLYNSANFFDPNAIPVEDYDSILELVQDKQTVIVENHPKILPATLPYFQERLPGTLEIAMGLETIHPDILPRLNKRMDLTDFERACEKLINWEVQIRTFILLRPPGLNESEGCDWALRAVEFAFRNGVGVCTIIPTRAGNGMMETLQAAGHFQPPTLRSLESVLEAGLAMEQGRVFVDLWDAETMSGCQQCKSARIDRMQQMNFTQQIPPAISCDCDA